LNNTIGNNPAGLIWESTKLSFAIDWLLSLDNVLDLLWLRSQERFEVQYWSSLKYQYERKIRYQICTVVTSADLPYIGTSEVQRRWSDTAHPVISRYTSYQRWPRLAPDLESAVRARGANVKNLFLAALIALGVVGKR
jgi:hypothetical protein